jgi:poly-gamma-glutamate capsule biosynthesis protein CapA/YwtB (metallophosphatase superfamily)
MKNLLLLVPIIFLTSCSINTIFKDAVVEIPETWREVEASRSPHWLTSYFVTGDIETLKNLHNRENVQVRAVEIMAVAGDISNPVQPLSIDSVFYEGYELKPLEQLRLPRVALPVEGAYPGEPDYPLYRAEVLRLESDSQELQSWFTSYKKTFPEISDLIWIAAVGDIMPERGVRALLLEADGLKTVFSDLLPHMQAADLLLGNLEGAVTSSSVPTLKSYNFKISPEVLDPLYRAGFDYLSLVNNHSWDFGREGFEDSLRNLQKSPIQTSGVGMSLEEAKKPAEIIIQNSSFQILSAGAYPRERNGFDGARLTPASADSAGVLWKGEDLDAALDALDPDAFSIVFLHGGAEWSLKPDASYRTFCESLLEKGVDLVLSSHPHIIQGLYADERGVIAYSLGNFIFPGMKGWPDAASRAEDSIMLSFGIYRGEIRAMRAIGVQIDNRFLSIDATDRILGQFYSDTRELTK